MITAAPLDVAPYLAPRALLHAMVAAACSGRPAVGLEVLADFAAPVGLPNRLGLRDAIATALPEAMLPLLTADLVTQTWAESGGVVYSIAEASMARLVDAGVLTLLVEVGLEAAPAPRALPPPARGTARLVRAALLRTGAVVRSGAVALQGLQRRLETAAGRRGGNP